MHFATMIELLAKRWWVLVLSTLVGAAAAFGITSVMPKTYESTGTLYITTHGATDAAALAQGTRYVQDQMRSYPTILESPSVLSGVISERGLATTPFDLAQRVSSTIPMDTTIMSVSVTSESPEEAAATAEVLVKRFTETISRLETRPGAAESAIRMTLIDPPSQPTSPVAPSARINVVIGAVTGLLLGAVLLLATHLVSMRSSRAGGSDGE